MSYNSKLEQTGRKVASARRKYYGSFDYGPGITAKRAGGSFSFGRRYDGGGDLEAWYKQNFGDDWVYDEDELALTRDYWNAHPSEYFSVRGIDSDIIKKWEDSQNSSKKSNGLGWLSLANVGLDGISNIMDMDSKDDLLSQRYDALKGGLFNGVTDNNSLLSSLSSVPRFSTADTAYRDKTVGQDIKSVLGTGVNTLASTGGNYWMALGAMALDTARIGVERYNAKRLLQQARARDRYENMQLNRLAASTAQDVDAINDWRIQMGYHNNPFEYAYGGPLHSNGGDYNGKLTYINAGGTHEQNPNEGVLSGFGDDGVPNLVEEGEVIWDNSYVFSDRLHVPKPLVEKYKLGGKKDKPITFADAISDLTFENSLSPNDPITIDTTKEIVNEFMDAQEQVRAEEQESAARELETAQNEDFLERLLAAQGRGMTPMDAGMPMAPQQEVAPQAMPDEAPVTEGEMMPPGYAFGGHKFEGGGWEDFFKMLEAYRGSLGLSNAAGKYAVDRNAEYWNNRTAADVEAAEAYGKFTDWVKKHSDDENVRKYFEYLDKGINRKRGAKTLLKYDKDGKATGLADDWESTFDRRRTDKALGIYHLNPNDISFLDAVANAPSAPAASSEPFSDINNPIGKAVVGLLQSGAVKAPAIPASSETTKQGAAKTPPASEPKFKYRSTWERDVPIWGAADDYIRRRASGPDYSNADAIISAASALGIPVNIPVETIGDYRRRNPFDERHLVNMANQNRVAGARGVANTSAGNRSMDLLGNMSLAHSSQYDIGEIMRQAYLANRQDDATVAEFNRGTNIQNMGAINQRNLSQAQLNSSRQQAAFNGLAHGYSARQSIFDNWDDASMDSYDSFLASMGAKGKENEEYNILTSMAEQGYYPWYYGNNSVLQFVPRQTAKKGGKLNRKKRRF